MGKSTPKAPDPKETGAAQTGTNVGTAIANTMMGFVNQNTPNGTLNYEQTGSYTYKDPYTGEKYEIPTFTATQELSRKGELINNANQNAQINLARLARDQSSRLNDVLGKPFDLKGLPKAGDASKLGMPTYSQFASAPELATTFGDAGAITSTIANAGDITRSIQDAGAIRDNIANAGQITREFGDAGEITKTIANAGDITKTYGANDFSADRTKVEEALMARMQPYLDKTREQLESRLANQGVRLGSDAYSSAQYDYGRQQNDAMLANIIAAGQEQSRMVGMDRDRAMFQNSAQAQQYGQNANDSAFANAAQQQLFGQLLGRAQFSNQAQAQQYGQNANDAQFANAAQAQRYGQYANNAAFSNAAQAQQYGQNANDAQFANAAQQQNFGQLLGRAQFGNTAAQQNFGNQFQVTGANNSLADQSFNAQIARLNAQNQQRQQALTERFAVRNQPINEISSLLSGSQLTGPQWASANVSSIPTTDYAGIINQDYQNRMQAYQAQQANIGGLLGGLGSLLSLSDKRAKKDIKPVGKLMGQNLYEYRYRGEEKSDPKTVGVMAQEVERKRPDAVVTGADGLKRVNYGLLFRKKAA